MEKEWMRRGRGQDTRREAASKVLFKVFKVFKVFDGDGLKWVKSLFL